MALQLRRGTDAERQGITPKEGELIYATDTNRLWVGGKIAPNQSLEQGGILVSGSLVNDTNPILSADLNLNGNNITGTGNISINGNITATGNINLGDGVEDNVIVGGQITGDLIPGTASAYDLGASASTWKTVYAQDIDVETSVSAGDVYIKGNIGKDDSTIIYDGTTGDLSVGNITSLGGISATGNISTSGGTISATGNISTNGDFVADGDVLAANISAATLSGDLLGGSVFANDSTLLIDADSRVVTNGELIFEDATIRALFSDNIRVDSDNFVVASSNSSNNLFAISPQISLEGSRGTDITPETVLPGDYIGAYGFNAYNGVVSSTRAYIIGEIDSVTGTNALPGKLNFVVNDADGNWSEAAGASLNSRGVFQAPTFKNLPFADTAARDAAHPSPEAGMIVFVTDGDGAGNPQFQGYDGSSWVALN